MVNVYFEITDRAIPKFGRKYFVSHDSGNMPWQMSKRLPYLALSDRAWMEQEDGKVWFIKHRWETQPTVDMKEFVWIKLSAEAVRG